MGFVDLPLDMTVFKKKLILSTMTYISIRTMLTFLYNVLLSVRKIIFQPRFQVRLTKYVFKRRRKIKFKLHFRIRKNSVAIELFFLYKRSIHCIYMYKNG